VRFGLLLVRLRQRRTRRLSLQQVGSLPKRASHLLMAKEKVSTRSTITYASSCDDESSDDEIDYASLFKGLDM
jgi:hypothetical protein